MSLSLRARQIKAKSRVHLTPVKMAFIKNTSDHKCGRECGGKERSCITATSANWFKHKESMVEIPQKTWTATTTAQSWPTPRFIRKGLSSRILE